MRIRPWTGIVLAAACLAASDARAQSVQLAPFAGYQFGGSFRSSALETDFSLEGSLDYGGTLDIKLSESWGVELLYSRQSTEIGVRDGATRFDLTVERYMAGVVEEHGTGRSRFYGVALAGVTRFAPGLSGFDADSRFTLGLGLGVKHFLSDNFGLRAEVRGFYTFIETGGGVFCNQGQCLFFFAGQGLLQGDVSGGIILAF